MKVQTQEIGDNEDDAIALYLSLMGPEATPEDWERYEHLAQTSSEHREIFSRCEEVWSALDDVDAAQLANGSSALAEFTGAVHARADDAVPSRSIERGRWSWAIAAMVATLLVTGGVLIRGLMTTNSDSMLYATKAGEHQMIDLSDGSQLVLGARSVVEVLYTNESRLVELREGELMVTVAHERERPFYLATDDFLVMATGTAFNVRNGTEYSAVSVVEGAVRVMAQRQVGSTSNTPVDSMAFNAAPTLHPGQQVRSTPSHELTSIKDVDIEKIISWQSGQLYFMEDNLATVFEAVARYSGVTFRLTDEDLRKRVYTGSFRPGHLESWLEATELAYSLSATRIGNDWIVTPAR